jgi:glycosyltransferase involved in cell wall biosynthesis
VISLGAVPERVTVVGTGIDTSQFTSTGPTADADHPYFVYAGTMSEVHGASIFVEAFAQVAKKYPEARLKMFGSGVEVEELKRRARESNAGVDFSGTVDAPELSSWIRGARASLASVRPQRGYDFAFATKALASLSCGVPVIYSGVGPLGPLIAENALGWSTEWDVEEVAEAMVNALERPPTGPDPRLSAWAESHFSLNAVADRAVSAIRTQFADAQ